MSDTSPPRIVQWLGYGGLIPPAIMVAADYLLPPGPVRFGGLVVPYAGLIFAFLGGTWWAFASREKTPEPSLMALAVAPPLMAFLIFFTGSMAASLLLAALIAISPLVDKLLAAQVTLPPWWMHLRFRLSMGLAGLTALSTYPLLL
ncbi:DUF3429 domain-containing protein [Sphingomicrobium clamense]|uniref:DUF3429 domain-containing protein n=1 Tax=Sphingomicrobium clamense TaxID=2851013 RepID=A0ABS6V5P2_9SPHN|nr:DUF3429 domain-containing protein [Sphingomicrobium sp. B8]MBW0144858.1 DUF3429 domain-containing protein [Sphingomicrobium sp. B8]